jgi:hypothetical protein
MDHDRTLALDIFTDEPAFDALSLPSPTDQLVADDADRKPVGDTDAEKTGKK